MDSAQFHDDTLVHVDPETETVLGKVEWDASGNPTFLPYAKKKGEKTKRKWCAVGTWRSVRGMYNLGSKRVDEEKERTLDEMLPSILRDE